MVTMGDWENRTTSPETPPLACVFSQQISYQIRESTRFCRHEAKKPRRSTIFTSTVMQTLAMFVCFVCKQRNSERKSVLEGGVDRGRTGRVVLGGGMNRLNKMKTQTGMQFVCTTLDQKKLGQHGQRLQTCKAFSSLMSQFCCYLNTLQLEMLNHLTTVVDVSTVMVHT